MGLLRDVPLICGGMALAVYETLLASTERPALLMLSATAVGLPAMLNGSAKPLRGRITRMGPLLATVPTLRGITVGDTITHEGRPALVTGMFTVESFDGAVMTHKLELWRADTAACGYCVPLGRACACRR